MPFRLPLHGHWPHQQQHLLMLMLLLLLLGGEASW
jgi:hypothetical protein